MANQTNLSQQDIQKLLSDPNEDTRAELTGKISSYYNSSNIGANQKAIIDDIFRVISKDISDAVRVMLAKSIKANPNLPKDIAQKMIDDIDSVATPVLEECQIFTDDEFIEIIKNTSPSKQSAIANRKDVSTNLCQALIDTNHQDVVANLVKNDGAKISEDQYSDVLDKFENNEAVQKAFVKRSFVPETATERLISKLSDQLKNELQKKHKAYSKDIATSFDDTREEATAALTANFTNQSKTRDLVKQIHLNKRLTSSLILRMLCMGDMFFLEEAFSTLANVPITNSRILIHDGGTPAFESIYKKAKLDEKLLPAFKIALEVYKELELSDINNALPIYRRTMIERILTQYEGMGQENLDYLLDKFKDLSKNAA